MGNVAPRLSLMQPGRRECACPLHETRLYPQKLVNLNRFSAAVKMQVDGNTQLLLAC